MSACASPNSHRSWLFFQRLQVENEAVLHISLDHAFPRISNLVEARHLDVGDDVVLAAEVQHLLRLRNAANHRTREVLASHNREGVNRERLLRNSHGAKGSIPLQQGKIRIDIVLRRDAIQDAVERAGMLARPAIFLRKDHLISPEFLRVLNLRSRGRELNRVRSKGMRELQPHMSEPTQSDDPNLLARPGLPVLQRRVSRNARAEQWRSSRQVQILRYGEGEILIENDVLPISAKGQVPILALRVIGVDNRLPIAVLLLSRLARGAGSTRVHHAADRVQITRLEVLDLGANRTNGAHNLMPRNHRIHSIAPLIARLVNV